MLSSREQQLEGSAAVTPAAIIITRSKHGEGINCRRMQYGDLEGSESECSILIIIKKPIGLSIYARPSPLTCSKRRATRWMKCKVPKSDYAALLAFVLINVIFFFFFFPPPPPGRTFSSLFNELSCTRAINSSSSLSSCSQDCSQPSSAS